MKKEKKLSFSDRVSIILTALLVAIFSGAGAFFLTFPLWDLRLSLIYTNSISAIIGILVFFLLYVASKSNSHLTLTSATSTRAKDRG